MKKRAIIKNFKQSWTKCKFDFSQWFLLKPQGSKRINFSFPMLNMYYLKIPHGVHVSELLITTVSFFLKGQCYLLTGLSIFYRAKHCALKAFTPLKVISIAFKKHPLLSFQGMLFFTGRYNTINHLCLSRSPDLIKSVKDIKFQLYSLW